MSQPSQHFSERSHVSQHQHQPPTQQNNNNDGGNGDQLQQQQPTKLFFAQKVGALPVNINDIGVRAIGLPETTALLRQQMQYWIEHDGSEATASADGAKAAERATRYIQHLLDQGGESAPRCPLQLQLQIAQLRLRDYNVDNEQQQVAFDPQTGQPIPQQQQQQQQQHREEYDRLTTEEQALFASLAPLSYPEALTYIPTLGRFRREDVEDVISLLR